MINLLEFHLSNRTYRQGAEQLFQQAQSTASGPLLLDSAHLFFLAGQPANSLDISLYLNNSAPKIAASLRALRVLYLSLVAIGKHSDAFQLCQELVRNELDSCCLKAVVAAGHHDIRRTLASDKQCWPIVESVNILGANNRICIKCTFKCAECERINTAEITSNLFRLVLAPCQHCLHPYTLSAIQLEPILHERYPLIEMDHYIGAELLTWDWVKDWWKSDPRIDALELLDGKNIIDAGMYDLRQLIAEAYYTTIAVNPGGHDRLAEEP